MSVRPHRCVIVRCDQPGCDADFVAVGTDLPLLARTDSTAQGWSAVAKRDRYGVQQVTDLCPPHASGPLGGRG